MSSHYVETICRLETRSARARRNATLLSLIVAILSIIALSVILTGLLFRSYFWPSPDIPLLREEISVEGTSDLDTNSFLISRLVPDMEGTVRHANVTEKSQLSFFAENLTQLITDDQLTAEDAATLIREYANASVNLEDRFSNIIVSAIFSLGTIGLAVLLIQISTNFIRYYSRLAEIYDSQADALRAANGDHTALSTLMPTLSPERVDFGELPTSIYEKAIDAISAIGLPKKR